MRCSNHPRCALLRNHLLATVSAFVLAHVGAQCAFADSGITNIIDGFTTNYASGYAVGTNGAFNALIVTNVGALLSPATAPSAIHPPPATTLSS